MSSRPARNSNKSPSRRPRLGKPKSAAGEEYAQLSTRLTRRQRDFVEQYVACRNGTLAARRAGYSGSDLVLRSTASENLTKPNIIEAIRERLKAETMQVDEYLYANTRAARASLQPFIYASDWEEGAGAELDLDRMGAFQNIDLVKKVKKTVSKDGAVTWEIELEDRHAARESIAKVLRFGALPGDGQPPAPPNSTINFNGDVNMTPPTAMEMLAAALGVPVSAMPAPRDVKQGWYDQLTGQGTDSGDSGENS